MKNIFTPLAHPTSTAGVAANMSTLFGFPVGIHSLGRLMADLCLYFAVFFFSGKGDRSYEARRTGVDGIELTARTK